MRGEFAAPLAGRWLFAARGKPRGEPAAQSGVVVPTARPSQSQDVGYGVEARPPVGAELLVADGHRVLLERGAGRGSGYDDAAYAAAGAELVESALVLTPESAGNAENVGGVYRHRRRR